MSRRVAVLKHDVAEPLALRLFATDLQHRRRRVECDHRPHVDRQRASGLTGPGGDVQHHIVRTAIEAGEHPPRFLGQHAVEARVLERRRLLRERSRGRLCVRVGHAYSLRLTRY